MVSRRAVLKSIGLVGAAVAAGKATARERAYAWGLRSDSVPALSSRWSGQPFGRVAGAFMNLRAEPSTDAEILGTTVQNDLFRIKGAVKGQPVYRHNDLWLETKFGYLYSSYIQPMWYHLPNVPQRDLGEEGRWAEVTVPFTEAYWEPDSRDESRFVDVFYYGSALRVTETIAGEDGYIWYKVRELYQSFHVRATHLRIMADEEITPLSPDVPPEEKHIEVNLPQQVMTAYEYGEPVFSHMVSTGLPDHATPPGTFYVHDKRLSERMVGGSAADEDQSDRYNLGGVPFTCYFTGNWVALHGCYWHNDYGMPRSRGCVNLPAPAARFIWRWTTPAITDDLVDTMFVRPSYRLDGTRVEVFG